MYKRQDKKQSSSGRHAYASNFAKRKHRGRDSCLKETASVLRALQSEYNRLQHLAKRHRCDRTTEPLEPSPSGTADQDSDASSPSSLRDLEPRQRPVFRDMMSRAIATQHLHSSAFVNSDVIRLLVPFNLDRQSTFVDCSSTYAQRVGHARDSLIGGTRVSEVVVPTNFQRMVEVLPMLARCPVLFVRNVPNYASNTTSDIVASLEHEQSGAGHGSSTPRKLLQMMFLNLRPLDVPSAVVVGTHFNGATRPHDMLIDDAYAEGSATSVPSPTLSQAEAEPDGPSGSLCIPTLLEHKSSNVAMALVGDHKSISALPVTVSGSHVIVITPMHELGDASTHGPHDSSLVWVSPWDNDDGGLGSPSPFVSVRADNLDDAYGPLAVDGLQQDYDTSAIDTSLSQAADVQLSLIHI